MATSSTSPRFACPQCNAPVPRKVWLRVPGRPTACTQCGTRIVSVAPTLLVASALIGANALAVLAVVLWFAFGAAAGVVAMLVAFGMSYVPVAFARIRILDGHELR